jgi:hypothetical protein
MNLAFDAREVKPRVWQRAHMSNKQNTYEISGFHGGEGVDIVFVGSGVA